MHEWWIRFLSIECQYENYIGWESRYSFLLWWLMAGKIHDFSIEKYIHRNQSSLKCRHVTTAHPLTAENLSILVSEILCDIYGSFAMWPCHRLYIMCCLATWGLDLRLSLSLRIYIRKLVTNTPCTTETASVLHSFFKQKSRK